MGQSGFSEEVPSELRSECRVGASHKESRRHSKCKGPVVGMGLVCSRHGKKTSVASIEGVRNRGGR